MSTMTATRVRFHRNGIGGESFYTVEFTDTDGFELVGIVFADCGGLGLDPETERDGLRVAVVCPLMPSSRYRGDLYAEFLFAAVRTADETGGAYE